MEYDLEMGRAKEDKSFLVEGLQQWTIYKQNETEGILAVLFAPSATNKLKTQSMLFEIASMLK